MYVWCIYIYIYSMRNNAKRAPPGLLARTRTHVLRFLVSPLAFFCVSSRGTKGETSRPERHEYLKKIMDASIRIFDGRGKKGNARTIRFFLWFRPRQIPPTTRYDVCYNIKVRSSDLELKGASETLIGNRTFYDRFSTPAKWIPLLETIKRIRPFSVMRPNKSNIEDEITILVIIVKLILRVSQRLTPFARGLSSGWTIL